MQDDLSPQNHPEPGITESSNRLSNAHGGAARYKKIEAMLKQIRLDKMRLEEKIFEYKETLAQEGLEASKLESGGISSFFHSAWGDLDEKLQKQRRDTMRAKLQCDQAEKEMDELNECIASLENEKKKLEGCGDEYIRLYKQKLQIMLREHGPAAERVMELINDINNSKAVLKEIKEALASGKNAMRYLSSAHDSLKKAESLGYYDMASTGHKGSMITGMTIGFDKYTNMDSAVIEAGIAQSAINSFKADLADLNMIISNPDITMKFGGFARFADIFFDRLTTDMYSQRRIQGSLGCVIITKEDVQGKVTMLNTLEFETQRRLDELKSKLDYIILGLNPNQEELSESIKELFE